MNKTELLKAVSSNAGVPLADATRVTDALLEEISNALARGDKVSLIGFGTFDTTKYAGRTGRNPKTGEALVIPASTKPKFSAGAVLKAKVANAK